MDQVERQAAKTVIAAALVSTLRENLEKVQRQQPERRREIRRSRFTITVRGDILQPDSEISVNVEPLDRSAENPLRYAVRFVD